MSPMVTILAERSHATCCSIPAYRMAYHRAMAPAHHTATSAAIANNTHITGGSTISTNHQTTPQNHPYVCIKFGNCLPNTTEKMIIGAIGTETQPQPELLTLPEAAISSLESEGFSTAKYCFFSCSERFWLSGSVAAMCAVSNWTISKLSVVTAKPSGDRPSAFTSLGLCPASKSIFTMSILPFWTARNNGVLVTITFRVKVF